MAENEMAEIETLVPLRTLIRKILKGAKASFSIRKGVSPIRGMARLAMHQFTD